MAREVNGCELRMLQQSREMLSNHKGFADRLNLPLPTLINRGYGAVLF